MIQTLLAGYGAFGRVYHKRLTEHPNFNVVGVVDNGPNYMTAQADGARVFTHLDNALIATVPDLVLVASSEDAHALLCVEAMYAGCDVLVAKPGATSLAEALWVRDMARSRQRRFMVDWTPLYMTGWSELQRAAIMLGPIRTARFTRRGWSARRACGPLWDLAPHDVALAHQLNPDDPIVDVACVSWGTGVHLTLWHQTGKVSRVECDYTATGRDRSVEVVGDDEYAEWFVDDPSVYNSTTEESVYAPDDSDAITKHLSRVVRVLRNDETDDLVLYENVIRVLSLAEADIQRRARGSETNGLAVAA